MIDNKQIVQATERAIDCFWESVAKSFPEAQTGDLSPLTAFQFSELSEWAVQEWAEGNAIDV
jgi:hypothetical protein